MRVRNQLIKSSCSAIFTTILLKMQKTETVLALATAASEAMISKNLNYEPMLSVHLE